MVAMSLFALMVCWAFMFLHYVFCVKNDKIMGTKHSMTVPRENELWVFDFFFFLEIILFFLIHKWIKNYSFYFHLWKNKTKKKQRHESGATINGDEFLFRKRLFSLNNQLHLTNFIYQYSPINPSFIQIWTALINPT